MGSNIGCDRQEKDFHDIHCCLSAAIPGSSDSSADCGDLRIRDTLIRILVCAFKKFIALNLFIVNISFVAKNSASTMMAVSMMGGVYAILPAYEADLFGTKFVGAIHGRMLLFSSAAALAGEPVIYCEQ